jgi:hypothetical protein
MSDRRGTDPAEPSALSGRSLGDTFPGVKTRAESSCPFLLRHPDYGGQVGVENPLRNLKLMLMGGCRTATEDEMRPAERRGAIAVCLAIGYRLLAIHDAVCLPIGYRLLAIHDASLRRISPTAAGRRI